MWAIVIAAVALLVSIAAAGVSLQQLREARKANTLPATVDLFREYRGRDMVKARRILNERLPLLNPENGVRGLPDDVAQAALQVGHYLDNLGVQVAHGLLAPELAAGFLGDSTIRLWCQLQPFIRNERSLRSPNAYLQYFEHLAATLRIVQPSQVRAGLLTWSEP